MPAQRLGETPSSIKTFDILAFSDTADDDLMLHAALSSEDIDATKNCSINIIHMGPPFRRDARNFDAVESCELTTQQFAKIKEFVDLQFSARTAEKDRLKKLGMPATIRGQYRIQPPSSRPRKGSALTRYSCVGFVLLAYKKARIQLLAGPSPLKTIDQIKALNPPWTHPYLDDESQRKDFGLREGTQWPVVLVGYVLHAMNRPSKAISGKDATPYLPKEGDEYFPRKPPVKSPKPPTTT